MPTVRIAFGLAATAVAMIVSGVAGVNPLMVMAAMLVVIVLAFSVDWHLAADPRRITVTRSGDITVRIGESAQHWLTLSNQDDSYADLTVRDAWVPSAGTMPFSHEAQTNPGESVTLPETLTPTRRGDRPAVAVTLRSFGPMRLAFRQATHAPEWTLRVLPRFESRRHLPEKLAKLRMVEGAIAIRGRGQGTEFDTLREYVPGDDVRSIDWRATARRADVMVRTWRPERSRRVVCVLDTGRTSAVHISTGLPRLDAAMDAALLLAAIAQEAGDQVDLIAVDNKVRSVVTGVHGRSLLPKLVNALAPLHPALVETDFELATSEILRRERKRSLVVIFTALEPGALGEGLLPVLPKLAAKHKILLAAVHDPALTELAATPITTPDGVYDAAAGTRALADRDRISTALTRNGVTVLDCPATTFASQVTDEYLKLKAAGQL